VGAGDTETKQASREGYEGVRVNRTESYQVGQYIWAQDRYGAWNQRQVKKLLEESAYVLDDDLAYPLYFLSASNPCAREIPKPRKRHRLTRKRRCKNFYPLAGRCIINEINDLKWRLGL